MRGRTANRSEAWYKERFGLLTSDAIHAAFEVHDWDDLMLGHDALKAGGYDHQWGVGKHILGSQVFDYWHDPFGNVMEHFTDGDLFDHAQAPGLAPLESLLGVQWGDRLAVGGGGS